jgi:hypothetical protein
MPLRDRPLPIQLYSRASEFRPSRGAAYIYGAPIEERASHVFTWLEEAADVKFAQLTQSLDSSSFTAVVDGTSISVSLRSFRQLAQFWALLNSHLVYLDITGLSHETWAPLVRVGLLHSSTLLGVYVEPGEYRASATPTEGEIFDLSEKIQGIAPLPGYAFLSEESDRNACFIAILGFEGTRLAYIVESIQPARDKIIPVIGVPGFRAEYPFHAYQGNRFVMLETRAWRNIRFARANCPFSLYYLLEDIAKERPSDILQVAMVGTKPHALGAVLFSLLSRRRVELVYDHPVRKATRTAGKDRLLLYDLSSFARL